VIGKFFFHFGITLSSAVISPRTFEAITLAPRLAHKMLVTDAKGRLRVGLAADAAFSFWGGAGALLCAGLGGSLRVSAADLAHGRAGAGPVRSCWCRDSETSS